jgi:hypothetical protein
MRLPTRQATDLLYTFLVDDICASGVTRTAARQAIKDAFGGIVIPDRGRTERNPQPQLPDRATWGLLPEHQAAQQRAMGLLAQNANLGGEVT